LQSGPPSRSDVRKIVGLYNTFIADVKTGTAKGQIKQGFRTTTNTSGSTDGLLIYNVKKLRDKYIIS
jgi:hypothetical protein